MIDKQFYWLVVVVLCVWRITHLLHSEHGPWNILTGFRDLSNRIGAGNLIGCFYCLSLWIAIPFAYLVGDTWEEKLLLLPAISAGAIIIERIQINKIDLPPVEYSEDQE